MRIQVLPVLVNGGKHNTKLENFTWRKQHRREDQGEWLVPIHDDNTNIKKRESHDSLANNVSLFEEQVLINEKSAS